MAEIDWELARERLETLRRSLEEGGRTAAAVEAALDARTRRLAAVPPAPAAEGALVPVLVFRMGGECWGLPADRVLEVLGHREPTPLPGVPPHVLGLAAYRGEVLPVFDLRRLLGLDAGAAPRNLVVAGGERPAFFLAVEAVEEVRVVAVPTIETLPLAGEELVWGIAPGALPLLDGDRLLRDRRLFLGQG